MQHQKQRIWQRNKGYSREIIIRSRGYSRGSRGYRRGNRGYSRETNKNSRFAPLLTFAEGDPEAEAEILSTVKQELSSHLQNLQQATDGELSIEAIGKTAHKLLPIATMIEMETRQYIAALAPEHISDLSESQIRAYTQSVIADLKALL